MPPKMDLKPIQQINRIRLQSISKHGLCDQTNARIVLNCVDLEDVSPACIPKIIAAAVFGLHSGIYSRALKGHQAITDPKLLPLWHQQDITERLNHCIVFIVNRPAQLKPTRSQRLFINFMSYRSDDLLTETCEHSILTEKIETTDRIIQIETKQVLSQKDIQCILVPEPFLELIAPIFEGIEIIPVPVCIKTLQADKNLGLNEPQAFDMPDFYQGLLDIIQVKKMSSFCFHTRCLHTHFDLAITADAPASGSSPQESSPIHAIGSVLSQVFWSKKRTEYDPRKDKNQLDSSACK